MNWQIILLLVFNVNVRNYSYLHVLQWELGIAIPGSQILESRDHGRFRQSRIQGSAAFQSRNFEITNLVKSTFFRVLIDTNDNSSRLFLKNNISCSRAL